MPPKSAPRGGGRGGARGGGAPRGAPPTRGAAPRSVGAGRGGTSVGPTLAPSAAHVKTIGVKRDGSVGYGQAGRVVRVQVNAFNATLPENKIYHYDTINPDNLPARVNYSLIKALQNEVAPEIFTPRGAYDGRKNMFIPTRLKLGDTDSRTFRVPMPQANGGANPTRAPKLYDIKVTYAAVINPELLNRFIEGQQSHDEEAITALTALNVAIRMEPNLNFPFNVRSFFIEALERRDIGAGMELWRGLFQSVRPGISRAFVNVDIATGIMYKRGPLIDLCLEVLHENTGGRIPLNSPNHLATRHGLPDRERIRLERFVRGIRVLVETTGSKPRVIRSLTSAGASQLTFTDSNGRPTTVAQYFQRQLGRPLRFPDIICAEVGRNAIVPLEVCTVPPGQIMRRQIPPSKTNDVLNFSKKNPQERFNIIRAGAQYLQYGQSEYIRSFGMSVDVASGPIEVNGRVLNAPRLQYGGKVSVNPNNGSWNMAGKKLFRPCGEIAEWIVVVYDRRFDQRRVGEMIKNLVNEAKNLGMSFAHSNPLVFNENGNGDVPKQLRAAGQKCFQQKGKPPSLVVVILPEGGDEIYTQVKHFGDILQGVATQCMKAMKVSRAGAQYMANVLLKVNVKLGGINTIPDPTLASSLADPAKPTIVMGADVIHPAPGAEGRPSFTAVVSSVDVNAAKYVASTNVQAGREEIIVDLKDMVKSGLQNYCSYRQNVERAARPKPLRLIFFRDGVSEGQFPHVIERELPAIKAALAELDMSDCKVTLVVVGKRHHIRFNAVNDRDKDRSGNAPAGLVVDRDIVHPIEFDFYLQSQGGLLGTSRSSHYSVLYDDNKFNADAMQALAFSLCHVYARATRSVSIPAPVYYADIVCARAKHHYAPGASGLSDSATNTSAQAMTTLEDYRTRFQPLSAYATRNMYFS